MKENISSNTFLLRFAVSVILAMHGIPSILEGSVNDFGNLYLNSVGFAPFGLYVAWAVKLTHVAAIPLLLLNKYLIAAALPNIFILIMGIVMVHYPEGWYVVGGGRNGVEFNFLLIASLVTIMFPNRLLIVQTYVSKK